MKSKPPLANHTPLPWKYVSEYDEAYIDGPEPSQKGIINFYLCDTEVGHANAAYIVRAVNAHEELIAALNEAVKIMESMGGYLEEPEAKTFKRLIQAKVLPAIAKAEGE